MKLNKEKPMKNMRRRDRKEQRRVEAKERQEKFDALTLDEKIEKAGSKEKKRLVK